MSDEKRETSQGLKRPGTWEVRVRYLPRKGEVEAGCVEYVHESVMSRISEDEQIAAMGILAGKAYKKIGDKIGLVWVRRMRD